MLRFCETYNLNECIPTIHLIFGLKPLYFNH